MAQQRHLAEAIVPVDDKSAAESFGALLNDFALLASEAEPEKLQRLLSLLVARIDWGADGATSVMFYNLPKKKPVLIFR